MATQLNEGRDFFLLHESLGWKQIHQWHCPDCNGLARVFERQTAEGVEVLEHKEHRGHGSDEPFLSTFDPLDFS